VQEVAEDCLWLALGPTARGRVHILDASDDLAVLAELPSRFKLGQVRHAPGRGGRACVLAGAGGAGPSVCGAVGSWCSATGLGGKAPSRRSAAEGKQPSR
jgi:hypothetical protein